MAEWLKAHAWKACLGETLTWVRIPLSPPYFHFKGLKAAKTAATFSATVSLIFPVQSVLAGRKAFTDEAHQSHQYVRAHGTRRYKKVPDRNRPIYPPKTTYVLRCGPTWETLNVDNLSDARAKRIEREFELLRGWRTTTKPKPVATKVKMLDEALDAYLEEIEAGRKPKTHSAYKTSRGYFFQSTGKEMPPACESTPSSKLRTLWISSFVPEGDYRIQARCPSPRYIRCNKGDPDEKY